MTMKSVSFQRSSLTGTRVQSGEASADHVLSAGTMLAEAGSGKDAGI